MKVQYFENASNEKQLKYLKNQNHCALCGHLLEFKFEKKTASIETSTAHESAPVCTQICEVTSCPDCEVQSKSHYYSIQ